jgi:hypothetical protein
MRTSNITAIDKDVTSPRGPAETIVSPPGSEDAIALAVVDQHQHELRYVAEHRRWYRRDGRRWARTAPGTIIDLIRPYVRAAALTLDTEAQQRTASRYAVMANVERLVRSDRSVAALAEDFYPGPINEAIGPSASKFRMRRPGR